jgi:protein-disulfide isomerase
MLRTLATLTLAVFALGLGVRAAAGQGQTPAQTPGQTSAQALGQTSAQTPGQTSAQTLGQTSAQTLGQTSGQTPTSGQAADPRAALLKRLPAGSKLEDLRPSPIPGVYEFMQGAEISYLTADGKYFIDGNLYDMDSRENLTEELRTHARLALISAVP